MRVDARPLAAGLAVAATLSLGLACERGGADRSFDCPSLEQVAHLAHVHYEGVDCDTATRAAESNLSAAYYRKACEQLSPIEGLPDAVDDAYVSACEPGTDQQGGSVLQIELCCH